MKVKGKTYWRWLPAVVWMGLIFGGSGDGLSAAHTSRWLEPFMRWLLGANVSAAGIEWVHVLVRKAGHVSEYAVLATLFWWALQPPTARGFVVPAPARLRRVGGLAIALAAAFAASDEIHQSFVPSRSASVGDVCLDTVGAALGVLAVGTWRWWRDRRRTGV